jgi:hypothetical protein
MRTIVNTQDAYLAVGTVDGHAVLSVSVGDRGSMHSAGAVFGDYRLTAAQLRSLITELTRIQAGTA